MKYAGGCFGCLTLIFILTGVVLTFATGSIISMIAAADPSSAADAAPILGYLNYANSGCCCLSGVLAVVFLAVGMSKKEEGAE